MADTQETPNVSEILKTNKSFITKLGLVGAFIVLMSLLMLTCTFTYSKYQDYRVEQAAIKKDTDHKNAQAIIRGLIEFCDFANIKDDERVSLDKCGDDVEAVRFALGMIVDRRVIFWKNRIDELSEKAEKLLSIKRNASYWSPSNESQFRELSSKLVKDYEEAKSQKSSWAEKGVGLKTFQPKGNTKTLEEEKPVKKPSTPRA